jgi:hypothetical protein
MKPYNKRTWLNDIKSSSTSSIVTFDGNVQYPDKIYRDTFVKISDCKDSIKLHKKDTETMEGFITKLKLLKIEIELFINHLNKNI